MAKRKISPLQTWKAQYNYMAKQIRAMKDASKHGVALQKQTGFITPAQQHQAIRFMRFQAQDLMINRQDAAAAAQQLWAADNQNLHFKHNQA